MEDETREALVFDTPESIEMYRILACRKGLEIEIRTQETFGTPNNGLTRGLAFRAAKEILGKYEPNLMFPRTRKRALERMNSLIERIEEQA